MRYIFLVGPGSKHPQCWVKPLHIDHLKQKCALQGGLKDCLPFVQGRTEAHGRKERIVRIDETPFLAFQVYRFIVIIWLPTLFAEVKSLNGSAGRYFPDVELDAAVYGDYDSPSCNSLSNEKACLKPLLPLASSE